MTKFYLPIPTPKFIESIIVYFLLRYRKKHYRLAFRRIKLIGGQSAGQKPVETNLTAARFAIVDPEDYQKLTQYPWQLVENGDRKYYASCLEDNKVVSMHREIMNAPKGKIVDHKNRDGLDNTKRNLRFATIAQNNCNVRKTKKGSSKYRGVCRNKKLNKWQANIRYKCRKLFLGYFENEEDAARAYDEAAKIYHGEFAVLNFPEESQKLD